MAPEQRPHRLVRSELEALASGRYTEELTERLRSAEYSRNSILAEALRRSADDALPQPDRLLIKSAMRILSDVQARSPDIAERVLTSPNFGIWVADSLIRLRNSPAQTVLASATTREGIARIAAFAASAALMAGCHFELTVPVQDGRVYLPGLGSLPVAGQRSRRARARLNANGLELPVRTKADAPAASVDDALSRLERVERISVHDRGLSLDLVLDNRDPSLSQLGPVVALMTEGLVNSWQTLVEGAWALLVSHHEPTARALSRVVTTLVPLEERAIDHPISVTSGWAWGAIGLSLPADRFSLAETLIHEFRHLVLAAVEDIASLTHSARHRRLYSPWRDDPRPASSLLQAAYAFSGVSGFWRGHRHAEAGPLRRRAELAFAVQRLKILHAVRLLRDSGTLTSVGLVFVEELQQQTAEWVKEPVDPEAGAVASEIVTEHYLRWRLANLVPEERVVTTLTRAWLTGQAVPIHPDASGLPPGPSRVAPLQDRSRFLERRFLGTDSALTKNGEAANVSYADDALMSGENIQARDAYAQQVSESGDRGSWIGLMLALRRLGALNEAQISQQPIETIAAVADRVRSATGGISDVQALVLWLAETPESAQGLDASPS